MVRWLWVKKRMMVCLWGMGLLFLAVFSGIAAGRADAESGGMCLFTRREGETVWLVCVSRSLSQMTEGQIMALLLTLEAGEGWEVTSVEAMEGAEGLILTVGECGQRSVTVLLDGRAEGTLQDFSEVPILRVCIQRDPRIPTDRGASLTVMGERESGAVLYCMEEAGNIQRIPLSVQHDRNEEQTRETSTDTPTAGAVTEAGTAPGTDSLPNGMEAETEAVSREPRPQGGEAYPMDMRFIGCQETVARDGIYAVRFLFGGKETAVVCAKGGGVLSATVSEDGNGWTHCTFRGLREQGRYVFWVYTEDGVVGVLYEDGRFGGYFAVKTAP